MNLIIGGAYQGKIEYAKMKYGFDDFDIFVCGHDGKIDFTKKCIDDIEKFTLWCAKTGCDPLKLFISEQEKWKDSVLICDDIFCGVVPVNPVMRKWREITGQLCGYLSKEAICVYRIYFGLEQLLK